MARPEMTLILCATIVLGILAAAGLAYPMTIGWTLDIFTGKGGQRAINRAILILFVLFVLQGFWGTLVSYLFSMAGERVVARLRRDLYAAILRQEIAFFDEQRTGELTSRLVADASVLQSTTTSDLTVFLRYVVTLIGSLIILFWTSWRLTFLMLSIIPVMMGCAILYGRIVRRLSREAQAALADTNDVAQETLAGIRTVRAFARESSEVLRYQNALLDAFWLTRKRALVSSAFSAVLTVLGLGFLASLLWYGASLVFSKQMRFGDLAAFVMYTMMMTSSFGGLTGMWTSFMTAIGSSERVFELLDRVPALPAGSARPEQILGEIRFEQIDFSYPTRPDVRVLRSLSLHLRPGEVVAVVGHSGAGKSTIAALLSRFYDPQAGRILLDGIDLRDFDPDWLRQCIGVVSQEPTLFATSIAENISYGKPGATQQEIEMAARAANAHDFIRALPEGYKTLVGERGVQLSGGQKQRIAIARAILKNPRILVLDEATSALDAESEALVQDALDRFMRGRTTIVIAHRLSTVVGADRVLVLEGGVVVQQGCHAELVSQEGLYRKLVERQFAPAAPADVVSTH
jgi:ATP-binding cassette subfamily B protein